MSVPPPKNSCVKILIPKGEGVSVSAASGRCSGQGGDTLRNLFVPYERLQSRPSQCEAMQRL